MADLNNLLAELERNTENDQNDYNLAPQSDEINEAEDDAAISVVGGRGEVDETGPVIDRVYEGVPEVLRRAAQDGIQSGLVDDDDDLDPQDNVDILGNEIGTSDNNKDMDLNLDAQQDVDYARLKAAWIRELQCPELLPYDQDTISLELELIEGQQDAIDAFTSTSNVDALINQIYRLDVERTKFLVTDLLTTRLNKVEDHALYNRSLVDRMSDQEVSHLKSYGELLEKHFHRTVLDHMPKDAWKRLDEPDMVETPDLDRFLFCKPLEDVEIGDQIHTKGSYLVARYPLIQKLVLEEKVDLLM